MPHQSLKSIRTTKFINESLSYRIFKWYELGILGVGKSCAPTVDMSKWIDFTSDLAKSAEAEVTSKLGTFKQSHFPKNGAYVPEDVNGKKWVNYFVWNAEQCIPEDQRKAFTKDIQVAGWAYKNGLAVADWTRMDWIVKPTTDALGADGHLEFNKLTSAGIWQEDMPALKQWIESWNIFEDIGRIVIFENLPGNAVGIHRDSPVSLLAPNLMQNISIQFKKDRPTFVYDEVTKEKIYHNTQAYCFNICDNHGVDAEDTYEFTIRMDGKFTPAICEALGLVDGAIWCKDYPSATKIKNIQIFEPEERP
jgi:hypothetical protein